MILLPVFGALGGKFFRMTNFNYREKSAEAPVFLAAMGQGRDRVGTTVTTRILRPRRVVFRG